MKSVLLSTRPKWCEKICHEIGRDKNGKPIYEKPIEVRKTKPSIPTPFKVLLYCTSSNVHDCLLVGGQSVSLTYAINYKSAIPGGCEIGNGKVIGEFVCDRVDRIDKRGINNNFDYCYLSLNEWGNDDIEIEIKDIKESCVPKNELNAYGANSSCLYAWHISDLKIYDKPKELSEFYKPCPTKEKGDCLSCDCLADNDYGGICTNNLTRPPQSYMYVEEV